MPRCVWLFFSIWTLDVLAVTSSPIKSCAADSDCRDESDILKLGLLQTSVQLQATKSVRLENQAQVSGNELEMHGSRLERREISGAHKCLGEGKYISCKFDTLCLDTRSHPSRKFVYFTNGSDAFEQRTTLAAQVLRPKKDLTLNVMPPWGDWGFNMVAPSMQVKIEAVPDALPADAAIAPDDAHVILQTYEENNFGHIMDNVWLAYRMQSAFNIPFNARIMLVERGWHGLRRTDGTGGQIDPSEGKGWQGLISKVFSQIASNGQEVGSQSLDSKKFLQQILNMSTNHIPQARYICFPNAIVGSGAFSISNPAELIPSEWWNFRSVVLRNVDGPGTGRGTRSNDIVIAKKTIQTRFGLSSSLTPESRRKREGKITLDEKLAMNEARINHYLSRVAELEQSFQQKFPGTAVEVVDYSKLPMKDQVIMTSKLKALVSPPGGGSLIAVFLPAGASLIVTVESDLGDDEADRAQLFWAEFSLWESLPWLSWLKVPDMLAEEVHSEVHRALNKSISAPL